ncbi:MAG: toll/interleukin-1 receptor domain-containing protein [Proteobacteria bacterium]|nr:toll/interleukin-1 receptor domain-containing protein [Pseudomonadota bacterium]
MGRDVFISYSQADRGCADEIVARVEARGLAAWIAPRDVAPSADWAAEIVDAIAAARVMVLVLSASSNDSPQVRREVERAVSRQVRILPFRIDDVLPSKSLEYFLSAQHWLDAFPPPREPHYARLCDALEAVLAPGVVPPPAARAGTAGPRFEGAALARVTALLADEVGPIAGVLVRRAAAVATDWRQLTTALAGEIGPEAARREFLRRCD